MKLFIEQCCNNSGELLVQDILQYKTIDSYINMIANAYKDKRFSGHFIPAEFYVKIGGVGYQIVEGEKLGNDTVVASAVNAALRLPSDERAFISDKAEIRCYILYRKLFIEFC